MPLAGFTTPLLPGLPDWNQELKVVCDTAQVGFSSVGRLWARAAGAARAAAARHKTDSRAPARCRPFGILLIALSPCLILRTLGMVTVPRCCQKGKPNPHAKCA